MYDLRDSLRKKQSDLLIRFGKIETVVGDVLKTLEANGDTVKTVLLNQDVSCAREIEVITQTLTISLQFCSEEMAAERKITKVAKAMGAKMELHDTAPLSERICPMSCHIR